MKILVLADHESKSLYDFYQPEKLADIDLIISCGDLRASYLSFFATFCHAPVLYISGNHDKYDVKRPEGCICIEDEIFTYRGVRILGLGGSMRYKPGPHQFSQWDMNLRVLKLRYKLWRAGGFDILLTHSPAFELNDGEDLPHTGFQAFRRLIDQYSPQYFIHGHVHSSYGGAYKRLSQCGRTTVINAYERYDFEYPDL